MRLETFRGRTLPIAFEEVRQALGEDALIVSSRVVRSGDETVMEVIAVAPQDIANFHLQLAPAPPVLLPRPIAKARGRPPLIIALIGPTGSGKTLTAEKLALYPHPFGVKKVGLLTLEHYHSDSPEQLNRIGSDAHMPVEIVRDLRAIEGALKRLSACDMIIADLPGEGPRRAGQHTMWRTVLQRLKPDETHLVIPATIRADLVPKVTAGFRQAGATHTLITKLDEVPGDFLVAQLAAAVALPVRWVTDGQDVPGDLHEARPRLISALGMAPGEEVAA
jgi:flagellar biosynthesis protein FlhF